MNGTQRMTVMCLNIEASTSWYRIVVIVKKKRRTWSSQNRALNTKFTRSSNYARTTFYSKGELCKWHKHDTFYGGILRTAIQEKEVSEYSCGSKACFCGLYASRAVKVFSVDPNFLDKEWRPFNTWYFAFLHDVELFLKNLIRELEGNVLCWIWMDKRVEFIHRWWFH